MVEMGGFETNMLSCRVGPDDMCGSFMKSDPKGLRNVECIACNDM